MAKGSMKEHFENRFGGDASMFTLEPPLPTSLNIELNNTCNQKCVFCPFHSEKGYHLKPAVMNKDFAKFLLDQAAETGIGSKELGFYIAGEPLLYQGLEEVIGYAKGKGFPYIFLTSNGILATLDKMKGLINAGLDSIRFSFNAIEATKYKEYHGTDTFEVVRDNIRNLGNYVKDNNIDLAVSLSCVITKETMGIQAEIRKMFQDYVDEIIFLPVSLKRIDLDDEAINRMSLGVENHGIDRDFVCPMLFNTMYINARKQVAPCCEAYDTDCYFAQLDESSNLADIWKNEIYKRHRKIFVEGMTDEGTICSKCQLRCGGLDSQLMDE